ncbi:hypothetical protein BDZ91DRAFT_726770 [Kalaharituber pfeilii]|nr:hypothetical protein BDZ91DRAFT_726770 [Kalaharituber pfeilii]
MCGEIYGSGGSCRGVQYLMFIWWGLAATRAGHLSFLHFILIKRSRMYLQIHNVILFFSRQLMSHLTH